MCQNMGLKLSQVKPSNCFSLFQFTVYTLNLRQDVNDLQTLNDPGYRQLVGASKI